jgi:hypothetical protein
LDFSLTLERSRLPIMNHALTSQTGEPETLPTGADCPWQVSVGRQGDGWVFALEPLTRAVIERRFPGSCGLRNVFLGSPSPDAFLDDPERRIRLFGHVLRILTELDSADLAGLGEIRFIDPLDGTVLSTPSGTSSPLADLLSKPHDPR